MKEHNLDDNQLPIIKAKIGLTYHDTKILEESQTLIKQILVDDRLRGIKLGI